jgi:hypothetical protein
MMFRLRTRTLIDVCINLIMGGFVSWRGGGALLQWMNGCLLLK